MIILSLLLISGLMLLIIVANYFYFYGINLNTTFSIIYNYKYDNTL